MSMKLGKRHAADLSSLWCQQAVDTETCQPGPKGDHVFGGYEDALFEQQVQDVVAKHPVSEPLFLFWAPHIGRGRQGSCSSATWSLKGSF